MHAQDQASALAAVERIFEGMRTANSAMVTEVFAISSGARSAASSSIAVAAEHCVERNVVRVDRPARRLVQPLELAVQLIIQSD